MNQVASWLPPTLSAYNVKLFRVSVANDNSSVVKSVLSQRFMEYLLHIIFDHSQFVPYHSVKKALKSPTSTSALGACCLQLLFTKCKRVTDHYSMLLPKVVGFPQSLLPP